MLASHLKQLYLTCDRVIIRNLRNRRLVPANPNPGLNERIKAFQKEGLPMTDNDADEFIEQSASDFYKVGEVYNEHLNERLIDKYELRHHIVKEKYFKEHMPNLLTWSEKEQIRHLATEYPDEWTPERIAESFPVTVPVVKKLLKYPWKPATEQRIARHDASVMRNWRELKEGTLEIPKDLQEHFLKFSERTIPPLNKKSIKVDITLEKNLGEYEKIIMRCARTENKSQSNETVIASSDEEPKTEENVNIKRQDHNRITLDELATKIKHRLDRGSEVDIRDKIILDTVNTEPIEINVEHDTNNQMEPFESKKENELTEYKEQINDNSDIMDYPERIRIPKQAYKKGATYKVNDCYYDHDGKFLYRVLGMSNS